MLARTGVRRLEVTSFVRADVIPQLADGAEVLRRADIPDDVAVTVLIPNERGLDNALRAARPLRRGEPVPLGVRDAQPEEREPLDRGVAAAASSGVVARAREEGLRCEGVISVAFGCPYEGEVPRERVLDDRAAAGGRRLRGDRLRRHDRHGEPGAGGAVLRRRSTSALELTGHFHNTRGQGLANVVAALDGRRASRSRARSASWAGARCRPGATGNIATEDLVSMLHEMGYETGHRPRDAWSRRPARRRRCSAARSAATCSPPARWSGTPPSALGRDGRGQRAPELPGRRARPADPRRPRRRRGGGGGRRDGLLPRGRARRRAGADGSPTTSARCARCAAASSSRPARSARGARWRRRCRSCSCCWPWPAWRTRSRSRRSTCSWPSRSRRDRQGLGLRHQAVGHPGGDPGERPRAARARAAARLARHARDVRARRRSPSGWRCRGARLVARVAPAGVAAAVPRAAAHGVRRRARHGRAERARRLPGRVRRGRGHRRGHRRPARRARRARCQPRDARDRSARAPTAGATTGSRSWWSCSRPARSDSR